MQYVYNVCHAICHETSEVLAEVMLKVAKSIQWGLFR